jgi:hypothetical protein
VGRDGKLVESSYYSTRQHSFRETYVTLVYTYRKYELKDVIGSNY